VAHLLITAIIPLMGKLIDFGGVSVDTREAAPSIECQHLNILLDENGQIVTCRMCGVQLTSWWALLMLVNRYRDATEALLALRQSPLELRVTEVPLTRAEKPLQPERPR
jgi:hypothetical protein